MATKITKPSRTQDALPQSEQHFQAVAELAVDAIVSADSQGTILFVNRSAEHLFGYRVDEVIGKPLTLLMPERFHAAHEHGLERFLETGEARVIGKTVELTGQRKDGSEFPLELSLSSWTVGSETFFTGILRDTTERLQANKELNRAAAIIEASQDAIVSYTPKGIIETWNPAAERLLGYSADEAIGESLSVFIPEHRRVEAQDILKRVHAGESVQRFETERVTKDGILLQVSLSVSPITDADGTIVGMSGVLHDIGEYKRAQEEADRLKEEFFGLVSHDLRTPLTSIKGYLELYLDAGVEEPTPEGRHFLDVIARNTERLERLVGDLVFVAQVEAGEFTLATEMLDLGELVAECVEAARPSAAEKKITLSSSADPLARCSGDRGRLGQLLDNLISNAVKYTPEGGQVEVRLHGEHGRALIEVEDSGIGIPAAEQKRLFERFFRASDATHRGIAGVGLGLTVVEAIAEGHGGQVSLESEEGVGTTFRVELPLRRAPGSQGAGDMKKRRVTG